MAILRIILLLLITLPAWSTKYYIAPTGNDTSGNGSVGSPYFTLAKAWSYANAGDTIYCRGGTYEYTAVQQLNTRDGSVGSYINIWAYPGEQPTFTRTEAAITGSSWPVGLIRLSGADYVYLRDLEITGFVQDTSLASICSGLAVYNSDNCIIERVNSHHNGHGILVYECASPQILYCDTHHNYDPIDPTAGGNPYGDGDGLEVSDYGQGTHTIIRGCRFWNNSDDGLDLNKCIQFVTVDSCWAWGNGYREDGVTTGGDGSGFKLGIEEAAYPDIYLSHVRTVTNNISFYNRNSGFNQNLFYGLMWLYNNVSYDNGQQGFIFFDRGDAASIIRNNISYSNGTGNGTFNTESTIDHNTFLVNGSENTSYSVSSTDFVSIDSTGVSGARSGNAKPDIDFLHLAPGSDLIDTGVDVGIDYNGTAPDLGAFEYVPTTATSITLKKSGTKLLKSSGGKLLK